MYSAEDDFRQILDRGFSAVRVELERGYEDPGNEYSEEFRKYFEDELVEAMGYVHSWNEFPEDFERETGRMAENYSEDTLEKFRGSYDVNPSHISITEFCNFLEGAFCPEEYDIISGIAFSGIPILKAAENHFDAEPSVLRFSKYDENDTKVMANPITDVDFEDRSVLLLDDVVFSGDTIDMVGRYLEGEGAEKVDAAVVKNFSDTLRGKVFGLVSRGLYRGIEETGRNFELSYKEKVRTNRRTARNPFKGWA